MVDGRPGAPYELFSCQTATFSSHKTLWNKNKNLTDHGTTSHSILQTLPPLPEQRGHYQLFICAVVDFGRDASAQTRDPICGRFLFPTLKRRFTMGPRPAVWAEWASFFFFCWPGARVLADLTMSTISSPVWRGAFSASLPRVNATGQRRQRTKATKDIFFFSVSFRQPVKRKVYGLDYELKEREACSRFCRPGWLVARSASSLREA